MKPNACPIDNCKRKKGAGAHMCWPHWRIVPLLLRSEIKAAISACEVARHGSAAHDHATGRLRALNGRAINFVNAAHRAAPKAERHADAHPCF